MLKQGNYRRPVMGTMFPIGLVALVPWFIVRSTDALECYTCTNATNIAECKSTAQCNTGEICFADHNFTSGGMLYSFGCRLETECKTVINSGNNIGAGSLVGRTGVTGPCSECCKEQRCNRKLCQNSYSEKECADSTEIHCSTVGAIIDMCSDTEKSDKVCRRFCGLCNYVNGQWGTWLAWSRCDISCGTGTKTRVRSCSEPAPSGGGHVCEGPAQDTDTCTKEPCPVHGSWATWAPWGSCSATCGIGLRRRDRSCSNPYPALFGDHCFGDARDDDLCLSSACADGSWADWTVWNTCSRTCGDGIKTRLRTCDNPLPSIQGKYCRGDPYQVITCNLKSCPETNGGWGTWSVWSHCSATCNTGMRSRLRDCDNPAPSAGGKSCSSTPYDVEQCMVKPCPRKLSAFTVKAPTDGYNMNIFGWVLSYSFIKFTRVILNEGNRYSNGNFTCLYPGLYYFEAYLTAKDNGDNHLDCQITKNSQSVVELDQKNPDNTANGALSTTGATTLHLVKDDVVNVRCNHHSNVMHTSSTFSGFLINSDP